MMLRAAYFWEKRAADAHDAGPRCVSGQSAGQLMLMMLAAGLRNGAAKNWATDAHDAGLRCASGKNLGS